MVGEVVQELLGRHQHGVQKLLNMGVANFGVGEYLTDEVHWSLDLQGASWLFPFDDQAALTTWLFAVMQRRRGSPRLRAMRTG